MWTAGAGILITASGVASAKMMPPANMPPPLTDEEKMVGDPEVSFSDVIIASGKPTLAPASVRGGGALISIPFSYRYTAVLTEDVTGFSFTVRGVQAPAGSPGYYVGSFLSSGAYKRRTEAPSDMWCFLPSVAGGKRDNICLFRNQAAIAAIAPTRQNPYLWDRFSPMTGTFDYVRTPIFERRSVDLPRHLTLEYRFEGWQGESAKISLNAVGDTVRGFMVPRDASGNARLRTIGGDFIVSRDPADPSSARIALP